MTLKARYKQVNWHENCLKQMGEKKYFFTQLVVNFCNLLPQEVVQADNVSMFRKGQNRFIYNRSINGKHCAPCNIFNMMMVAGGGVEGQQITKRVRLTHSSLLVFLIATVCSRRMKQVDHCFDPTEHFFCSCISEVFWQGLFAQVLSLPV